MPTTVKVKLFVRNVFLRPFKRLKLKHRGEVSVSEREDHRASLVDDQQGFGERVLTKEDEIRALRAHVEVRWRVFNDALAKFHDSESMMAISTDDATWMLARPNQALRSLQGAALANWMKSLIDKGLRMQVIADKIEIISASETSDCTPYKRSHSRSASWDGMTLGRDATGMAGINSGRVQQALRMMAFRDDALQRMAQDGHVSDIASDQEYQRGVIESIINEEMEKLDREPKWKKFPSFNRGKRVGSHSHQLPHTLALERSAYKFRNAKREVVEEGVLVALWQEQNCMWYICGLYFKAFRPPPQPTVPPSPLRGLLSASPKAFSFSSYRSSDGMGSLCFPPLAPRSASTQNSPVSDKAAFPPRPTKPVFDGGRPGHRRLMSV